MFLTILASNARSLGHFALIHTLMHRGQLRGPTRHSVAFFDTAPVCDMHMQITVDRHRYPTDWPAQLQ